MLTTDLWYLITIKTLTIKKTKEEPTKFEIFFCKVSSHFFSEDHINIQLYITCKAFIRSIV